MTSTSSPLARALDALAYLQELDRDMPVLAARCLMTVAEAGPEGVSIRDLMTKLDVVNSTVSKMVARLGKHGSGSVPGLNLLSAEESAEDRRVKIVTLTPKGERAAEKLRDLLE